jgi:hypothetical protein
MSIYVKRRIAELSEEIRRYPTPIARCDQHLAELIDRRAKLLQQLDSAENQGCSALALWANDGGFNAA